MRLVKELTFAFVVMIALYLVLIHATGFAKDVGAIGSSAGSLAKTFQGR